MVLEADRGPARLSAVATGARRAGLATESRPGIAATGDVATVAVGGARAEATDVQ